MSLHNSRFEKADIVNSFNIFLDSERANLSGDQQSEGDNIQLHFEGNSIEAHDGEILRLSLLNFTMYNNIYHVNGNNNTIRIFAGGATSNISFDNGGLAYLTVQNIERLNAIASNFGAILSSHLTTRAVGNGATAVTEFAVTSALPASTEQMQSTGTRLLDVTLESRDSGGSATAHLLTDILIVCLESDGESYALLGGNRIDGPLPKPNTTLTSFKITIPSATTIRIQGYYPMQRTTDPYVYVRCNQAQTGLEMSVLQRNATGYSGALNVDIVNSNILAKAFRQVEFIHYDAQSGGEEYFMNLQTKKLSNLNLFLTDSRGRNLGRRINQSHNGTGSGLITSLANNTYESDSQSTLGNLFFTGVLRVDIIKVRDSRHLESGPIPRPLPASKSKGVVIWQNGGEPRY